QGPDARDYFADARLTRDQDRSLRKQELRAAIDSPNVDPAVRKTMSEELQAVMKYASLETQAEALVRSRGVDDVMVTLTASDAMVSVRGKDDRQLAVQVADAVAKLTGLRLNAVTVRFQQ
ncbi:MAG TPA: SpoIIIAH-like family protein, partial [Symbiobacteriaceae bacterium]|nr:SpoIIIAH-like family protein [Symbiobacteriaceae bacterium]